MSESPKSDCEKCGGQVKRLITGGTGLIFKGSGFYLTDYKNNGKPKLNSSDTKKSEKVNSDKEGKSESKTKQSEKKTTEKKEVKSNE